MSGNDRIEELSTNKTRALAALLTSTSMAEAAETAGVNERTLRRWISDDTTFRTEYKRLRRHTLDSAVGFLQNSMVNAIAVLNESLHSGSENVRVRSAIALIDLGLKGTHFDHVELTELEEILPQLKRLLDAQAIERQQGGRQSSWAG